MHSGVIKPEFVFASFIRLLLVFVQVHIPFLLYVTILR